MARPAWEKLDAFFTPDEAGGFARKAVVCLQSGAAIELVGIFDDPFLNAELGEYDFNTSAPRFHCKSSDVDAVARGDTLILDGTTYDILDAPMHDGTGIAALKLAPR